MIAFEQHELGWYQDYVDYVVAMHEFLLLRYKPLPQ